MPIDHPGTRILYTAASPLERAMADADAERLLAIYAEAIKDIWDPLRVSSANLPYLAFAMGVTIWEDDYWTEGTKRDWVGKQWLWKSLRGTLDGIRMALEQSNYDLVDSVRPPQGFYASPELTKEEMDAWIRLMPELRIKFAPRVGQAGLDEFFAEHDEAVDGAPVDANCGFADADAVSIDDGWVLRGREAIMRYRGIDTPLHVIRYEPEAEQLPGVQFERVAIPGESSVGYVSDESFAADPDRFVCFEELAPRLVTLRLERDYSHDRSILALDTVVPGLDPLVPRYERNSDVGDGGPFFFVDDFCGGGTFVDWPDGGDRLLADRIYLLDPAVSEPMNEGVSFADYSRVGIPVHTAEIMVDLKQKSFGNDIFAEDSIVEDTYAIPEDMSHIDRAMRAIVHSKALRDTVLVSFAPVRPVTMGDYVSEATEVDDWVPDLL